MTNSNVEEKLKNAKFYHLTEGELIAYRDQELDEITLARAAAHLKLCIICERGLELLREELTTLEKMEITPHDVALVERVMQEARSRRPVDASLPEASSVPVTDWLAGQLLQLTETWRAYFRTLIPVRDSVPPGQEISKWVSGDGFLSASIILEDTSDLTIHISSKERGLAGQRIRVSLGSFSEERPLRRASESEVFAKVTVPDSRRPATLETITIEMV